MTPEERDRKLRDIARLRHHEIGAWLWCCKTLRIPFDGEVAALQERASQLGIPLKEEPLW